MPTSSKAPGTENLPRKQVPHVGDGWPKPRLARSKSSTMHHSSTSTTHGNNKQSCNNEPTTTATVTATTSTDTTDHAPSPSVPQSKLSRATQKPHVRKTRRLSSMERRRARYARLDGHACIKQTPV